MEAIWFVPFDLQLLGEDFLHLGLGYFPFSEEHHMHEHGSDVIERGKVIIGLFFGRKNLLFDEHRHFLLVTRENELKSWREMQVHSEDLLKNAKDHIDRGRHLELRSHLLEIFHAHSSEFGDVTWLLSGILAVYDHLDHLFETLPPFVSVHSGSESLSDG